jgi:hypothetical protein
MKFLEELAEHIHANYSNPGKICIVSPNKRAGIFLRKYLSEKYHKPVFSPTIFGIEDFFLHLSGFTIADKFEQLFIFYRIHLQIEKTNAETIDLFASWATTLLNDFNELDQYLIDTKSFFNSLNADRALEVWSPDQEELTAFQKQYLKFWGKLPLYYSQFCEELTKQKKAYTGMAFRMVAENIENENWRNEKLKTFEKIYFVGFNALTASEEHVLKELLKSGIAEVFWDADNYYLNDVNHEAGTFLRKNIVKFNNKKSTVYNGQLETEKKEINIYGVTGNIAQTKIAANIISGLKEDEHTNTAIVLADESLLIPLLNSLPESISGTNITMGFPLKNTNTATFFQLLIKLHLNKQKFSNNNKNKGFYHKDILSLLKHPYFAKLYLLEKVETEKYILSNNKVFFNPSEWNKINPNTPLPAFLHNIENPKDLIFSCLNFIETIKKYIEPSSLENEYIFYFSTLFNSLAKLVNTYNFIESLKIFQQFFTQFLQAETLPFFGEPLEGIQIMGVLETRTLDFKNVIFLSLNEGILPTTKQINSIIPFSLKINYKLPVYKEKDAIFSFHFYRLLQRAEKINLIYNSDNLSYSGSEKSRFITQLEQEFPAKNKISSLTKKSIKIPTYPNNYAYSGIQNNEFAINRMLEIFKSGISATHINTYINCKEDFYNKYILQLREENTVEENIEDHTIGTILHKTLEKIYSPYLGNILTVNEIKKMQNRITEELEETVSEYFSAEYFLSGKNYLAKEICKTYLQNYFKSLLKEYSLQNKKHLLKGLEQKLSLEISLNNHNINFKGTIDKIESDNNTVYIIDYKTGKVEQKDLKFENIDELFSKKEKSKAMQLFFYNWIYYKLHPETFSTSGIISLRSPGNGLMLLNNGEKISNQVFSEFETRLTQLIRELIDYNTIFTHNPNSEYCEMC